MKNIDINDYLIFDSDNIRLYNCSCEYFNLLNERVNMVFSDPPFGLDLSFCEDVLMNYCDGHTFLMTNEMVLLPFSTKYIDYFVRMYAINTVVPNLISNKAPMQLADFVSEFRFTKTKFINKKEGFSNLIEAKKVRMKKHYSQNFDKDSMLFAYFLNHFCNKGDTVLDPFSGSGGLPIACRKLGLKCIAFETNVDSCKHIINRLNQKEMF